MHQHPRQNTTLNGLSNGYKALLATPHRFTFNGMEKDDEVKGLGNSLDFGARIYDSRLGRWLSVDPLQAKFTPLSPYNYVANSPLQFIDINGEDIYIYYVSPGISPDEWFGHNAIGVKLKLFSPTYYYGASGATSYDEIEKYNPSTGQMIIRYVANERQTIKSYVDVGRTVTRLRIKLPEEVERNVQEIILDWNQNDAATGAFCTQRVKELLKIAYVLAGYSEKDAYDEVENILPNETPLGTPTDPEDAKARGYLGYDK
jgi:RHS repeat-associated protein